MSARNRLMTMALVITMFTLLAGTAYGDDGGRSDRETADGAVDTGAVSVLDRSVDGATDPRADRPSDRSVDKVTDHTDVRPSDRTDREVTDRPRVRPTDGCALSTSDNARPCVVDRTTDRITDRCAQIAENPRRCVDHQLPRDLNIRKLIWRLIQAHEWEKLVRLLHWLGWL